LKKKRIKYEVQISKQKFKDRLCLRSELTLGAWFPNFEDVRAVADFFKERVDTY
jgi:hypothetical protein